MDNDSNDSLQEHEPSPAQQTALVLTGAAAAGLGLIHPVVGVIAAGLAPYVATRLTELYTRRAAIVTEELKGIDLDLPSLFPIDGGDEVDEPKLDLLNSAISNALESGSREKVRLLLHLLKFGLESTAEIDVLFAKRVVRTMTRVDDLETILLASLARMDRSVEGVNVLLLAERCSIDDTNMVRSGLAVLESEGLVGKLDGKPDTYRVTDYGESVLNEFRQALGGTVI